jgi:hypothetical protein
MSNSTSTKTIRLSAWEKIFIDIASGDPVSKEYFNAKLGKLSYKISSYILEIKIQSDAVIRPTRDGKKVIAYQLMNPASAINYFAERGVTLEQIQSLSDLNVESIPADVVEDQSVVSEIT